MFASRQSKKMTSGAVSKVSRRLSGSIANLGASTEGGLLLDPSSRHSAAKKG